MEYPLKRTRRNKIIADLGHLFKPLPTKRYVFTFNSSTVCLSTRPLKPKYFGMKIKNILFFAALITFTAANFYIGIFMQGGDSIPESMLPANIPGANTENENSVSISKDTIAEDTDQNTAKLESEISKKIEETEKDFARKKDEIEDYYSKVFQNLREDPQIALKKLNYIDDTDYPFFAEQLNSLSSSEFQSKTRKTGHIGKPAADYENKMREMNKAAERIISDYKLDREHYERQKACSLIDLEKARKEALAYLRSDAYRKSLKPAVPKPLGTITGILSADGVPLTIINGDVYREGQSVNGIKIIKISRDYVEFNKEDICWTQKINETPSANWKSQKNN